MLAKLQGELSRFCREGVKQMQLIRVVHTCGHPRAGPRRGCIHCIDASAILSEFQQLQLLIIVILPVLPTKRELTLVTLQRKVFCRFILTRLPARNANDLDMENRDRKPVDAYGGEL